MFDAVDCMTGRISAHKKKLYAINAQRFSSIRSGGRKAMGNRFN